jgi:hypothetical protein
MKKQSIKKQLKKYYFNILALNTNTGKNHFFHSLYLTKKEFNEQVNYLMINGFNSISYLKITD